jgi:hypothetical protein
VIKEILVKKVKMDPLEALLAYSFSSVTANAIRCISFWWYQAFAAHAGESLQEMNSH